MSYTRHWYSRICAEKRPWTPTNRMLYAFAFCSPSACSRPSLNIHVFIVYVSCKLSVKQDLFSQTSLCSVCNYFACGSCCKVLWWVCLSIGLSVCLSARISLEPHVRSLPIFLCTLPMSVARSSSDTFTIGHITYRREGVSFPIENVFFVRKAGVGVHSAGEVCYLWLPCYISELISGFPVTVPQKCQVTIIFVMSVCLFVCA